MSFDVDGRRRGDVADNAVGILGFILGIDDAVEETWVVDGCLEAHGGKYFSKCIVPMVWASSQPVECLLEVPILIFIVSWISCRWAHGEPLVFWEGGIAKCIFAIALLENASVANGLRDK